MDLSVFALIGATQLPNPPVQGPERMVGEALETGKVQLDDLVPRIQQLRYRLEQSQNARWQLEQQISERWVELADEETVRRYTEDLRKLLSDSPLTERRSFIRSFVKEVKFTGDDVVLTYTIPMPPKGIIMEEVSVPSIVQNGGRYCTIDRTFSLAFSLSGKP